MAKEPLNAALNWPISRPQRHDLDQVFNLVNEAFKVEVGTEGYGFRKTPKYRLRDTARKQLPDMYCVRETRKIIGVVSAVYHNGTIDIGLLAVHPNHQGKGIGTRLLEVAETKGKADKCTMGVPSCRDDIIAFLKRRGYEPCVYKSIPDARKLYPEDLHEKSLAREDLEWVILVKKMEHESTEEEEDVGKVTFAGRDA